MLFDETYGRWMLAAMAVGIPALIGGWYLVRHRVAATADDVGHAGDLAVLSSVDPED